MKLNFTFGAFLFLSSFSVFSQNSSTDISLDENKKLSTLNARGRDAAVKRFGLHLETGILPIGTQQGLIDFSYVNPDYSSIKINNSIPIEELKHVRFTSMLFEWQSKRDIVFRTLFNVGKAGNNISMSTFSLGLGYAFGGERLQVFPFVDFGFGNADIDLGNLVNKYKYMYINDKEFNSSVVDIKFSNSFTTIRPNLGFNFNIVKWLSLRANVGYSSIKFKKLSDITYSGTVEQYNSTTGLYDNIAQSTYLPLSSPDQKILYNGENLTKDTNFFNKSGGLHYNVGLSINLVNNLFDGR